MAENIIDEIITRQSVEVQQIIQSARALIHDVAPNLVEEGKSGWGNLIYKGKNVVLGLNPHKKYVNLHFYNGVKLDDPAGVLEGSGKDLRHVKLNSVDAVRRDVLEPLLRQAVVMDENR